MSTRRTTAEMIEAKKTEMGQKKNELALLLQRQRKEERNARTHRLCERGGIVEKLLPDLARLDKEQFDTFVQKVLLSGFAEKTLRGLVPPEPVNEAETETDVVNDGGSSAAEAATVARHVSADSSAGTSAAARQAG